MKVLSFSQGVDGAPNEIHIVPIGDYPQRGFRITREDCYDIIRNFKAFGIKLVIDFEHQSLNAADNGQPAPAAGWISSLELRENGVYATQVEWTEEAREMIKAKKYAYVSPVLVFNDNDPHTNAWIGCSLHSVALTNTPYFRADLEPLINARYANNKPVDSGNKKEIGMTHEEEIAQLKAENAALTSKNAEMTATIAARDASLAQIETQKLVDDAIAAKKILPAQRETALFMANQGKEVFEKFVAATAAVNIVETQNIPENADSSPADPKKEYDELLRNPAKAEKMKQENPQAFNALRDKALYGGR
ncbi:MAG: phage protease [Candidatus Cloacimonetes bacterium]|nr:phage protease [Candidatus Cloacimonadota bacterium]